MGYLSGDIPVAVGRNVGETQVTHKCYKSSVVCAFYFYEHCAAASKRKTAYRFSYFLR